MNFDNLRLRTKVLIPLALMAAVVLAISTFGASRLIRVSSTAGDIVERRDVAAVELTRAANVMSSVPHVVFALLLYDQNDPAREASKKEFESLTPEATALLDQAAAHLPDKAEEIGKFKSRFQEIVEKAKQPYQISLETPGLIHGIGIQQIDLIQMGQAANMATEVDLRVRELIKDMKTFNEAVLASNASASQDLNKQASEAVASMAVVGVLATLLSGAFAIWLATMKVARPLTRMIERMKALARGELDVEVEGLGRRDEIGEMAATVEVFKTNAIERGRAEHEAAQHRINAEAERGRVESDRMRVAEIQALAMQSLGEGLKRVAEGDLTARLDDKFPSEFSKIRDDFNAAVEKLMETMSAIVQASNVIHSGSQEISSNSDGLSRRTEQQAASLEETAAALNEVTATVKRSAEGAKRAREMAANANTDAEKGAVVVKQAVEAMDAISKSSDQIGRIIGVIDEIAFQTNLLALNAGVEAARAGDTGRGFAVVASEVRALAQRAADAAKEIKNLISTSSNQVEFGVRLVSESGKALARIIDGVADINRIVADIATGAQEQATGLQQVNSAIKEMDNSTQKNAAMVEESATASSSLSQETSQLATLVEQFRVGEQSKSGAHPGMRSAPPPHDIAKAEPARARYAKPVGGALVAKVASDKWDEF